MLRLMRKGATFVALESEAQRRAWLYRTTLRICWDMKAQYERQRGDVGQAAVFGEEERAVPFEEPNTPDRLCRQLDAEERILAVPYFEGGYAKVEIASLNASRRA